MTSRSQNAPEACGSTDPIDCHSWFHHAQTQADDLFLKWNLSGGDGTKMEDAIAVLENALRFAETLPDIEPAMPAELLRRQGRYYQGKFFRKGGKFDAEEAARCLLKAL